MRRELLLLLAAALLLAGCSAVPLTRPPVQPPADPAGITLRVGDQKGGVQSLLRQAGLLDTPYRLQFTTFTQGPPLVEAARAGAIDIGQVGNTPAIFATAARARIQLVSASQGNVVSDAVLVLPGSPIRSVADLRGKRIAVGKGTSAHGQLLYSLRAAGMSLDDVDPSYLQPSDAYAAFKQGQVDAWATWDPYTAQAQLETGARTVVDGQGTANGYSFLVASNAALADPAHQAAVADLVERVRTAMRVSDADREGRARAWAQETKLPLPVTELAASRGPDVPVPMDDRLVASEQQLADAFTEAGVIPGRADFAAYVDRRFEKR